ncbi:hypothetical protein DFJ74DRAFT_665765 [Hyaloraphidium curvatum]|nr:hypothetical protein DFJ74DRAFT_665765 [Hyaloraphidium curvatum]
MPATRRIRLLLAAAALALLAARPASSAPAGAAGQLQTAAASSQLADKGENVVFRRSCAGCPEDSYCEYGYAGSEGGVACVSYQLKNHLYRRYAPPDEGPNCQRNILVGPGINPCSNGGTCVNATGTGLGFTCSCATDYTGGLCQSTINYCLLATCKNGATCTVLITRPFYSCQCQPAFRGTNCEEQYFVPPSGGTGNYGDAEVCARYFVVSATGTFVQRACTKFGSTQYVYDTVSRRCVAPSINTVTMQGCR